MLGSISCTSKGVVKCHRKTFVRGPGDTRLETNEKQRCQNGKDF